MRSLRCTRTSRRPRATAPHPPPTPTARGDSAELAAALAEELGLDAAEVTAALAEVHEARGTEARAALSDRLDEAVDAGDLTAADKASVLKAFDAGVLGGRPGGRPGRR